MEYLYHIQYTENHVWRDIYATHIMSKFDLKDEPTGLKYTKDLGWGHNITKYQFCMNHYDRKAQYECLKCGSFASLCFECANNKSNPHHNHMKKALFPYNRQPEPNLITYIHCINHPHKRARSLCLSCKVHPFAFLCTECSDNIYDIHQYHPRTHFSHDLIIKK